MSNSASPGTSVQPRAADSNSEEIASGLVGLLHRSATAEEFAARLAHVESLPDAFAGKSGLIELVRMAMALRNRLEIHEQRERGMLAVIESAQDLSRRLDLQGLLKAITYRARALMGSHLCWLTVVDAETGEFQVIVTDGAISQRTGRMTANRNLGVAGVVMATRLPFSTPDYLHDNRFVHDPVLDDTFRDEGVAALVGAPLIVEDEVIGLLFVADRYHRTHTALNVSILCTLATHAAVAIVNAKAFAEAKTALSNADLARSELEMHARDVQAAAEAHEQLTSLLARGASLQALCEAVAQQLDGDVLVLDEAGQVIGNALTPAADGAKRNGAAASYAASGEHSAQLTRALRESRTVGRSVVAFDSGGELCRAIAVIGGSDMLGAVLLFRSEDLAGISLRTFERCASVMGLVLLSKERSEAEKDRDVSTLMRSLVAPRPGEPALTRERIEPAERFGLSLSQPICVLVVEVSQEGAAFWSRRFRIDKTLCEFFQDEVDGLMVLLCNATRAQELADKFDAYGRRYLGGDYRGVLSKPVVVIADLPATYRSILRALPVVGRLGIKSRIVAQTEITLYSALFETENQSSLVAYVDSVIGAVVSYDRKRNADLVATLMSYFDCNQNATLAASRLDIHVNTVRQRLATAEELLGHWGSASRALEIHMALRLRHLGVQN